VDYYDITNDIHLVERLEALAKHVDANALRNEIGQIMFEKIGIIRTEADLQSALKRFEEIEVSMETMQSDKPSTIKSILELINVLVVAKAVAKSALLREESRGSHFRIDYPEKDRKFKTNTLIGLGDL